MKLDDLKLAVDSHSGKFICVKIHDDKIRKEVVFTHQYSPPYSGEVEIALTNLSDFYETFGSLILYHHESSNDAAFYIGSPDEWSLLDNDFRPWLDGLDEDEADLLPAWINDCLVFGEIPSSGNYLLMPVSGEKRGYVFEFEHDGFEFIECARDIESFVSGVLNPSVSMLTEMASHMRFIENDDYNTQWWIAEMHDNKGNLVKTKI